jgi:inactivated superfamily I helicase
MMNIATMKKAIAFFFFLSACMFISATARAENAESFSKARSAADSWLAIVDSTDYAQSWEKTAELFRSTVTRSKWKNDLEKSRLPLGGVKSRTLESADFTRTLPNAPAGEYVVVQYASLFDHDVKVIETVTSMREADGSWKVTGYYIRPLDLKR